MAIEDDISVAVNGDIRYTGTTANYSTIEFHRYLQALADNAEAAGDDLLDITSDTPTERATDQIVRLLGDYNIDATLAQHLYGGSIRQDGTNTLYAGLSILGSVNNSNTTLEVIQDGTILTSFWGDQSTGGYNSSAGVLAAFLVLVRDNGADIDGKRIRVQARHWGDTYAFFEVGMVEGVNVAAISTTPDPQNDTLQATVTGYTHVTNTEGFQGIDLNNGNGSFDYYSQWTFGADTSGDGNKGLWEFTKDLTGNGTAKTIHGVNGELFLGVTHSMAYDGAAGTFQEDEFVAWGTDITFDAGVGTFVVGEYVTIGSLGAAGQIVGYTGAGATGQLLVALEDTSITLVDGDTITAPVSSATADINVTIVDNNKSGGTGLLLALDDNTGTGNFYIQLWSGIAPVDNLPIEGRTSGATCLVNGTPLKKTVPQHFIGSYTGSVIGAYGVGFAPAALGASDKISPLVGADQSPPNNVTYSVLALVIGDQVMVTAETGGGIDFSQLTLSTSLSGAAETSIVCTTAIPTDTPASGTIRVQLDNDTNRLQAYTSYTGSTFTIPSTDYSTKTATNPRNVFVTYIDKAAAATTESFTSVYLAPRNLFTRVRWGGASPIKTFETTGVLGSAGGSSTAIRTPDA